MNHSFFGSVLHQSATSAALVLETSHPSRATISRHEHPEPYLSFLVRGSYHEHVSASISERKPHTAVLHPAGESHSDSFSDGGAQILSIIFSDSLHRAYPAAFSTPRSLKESAIVERCVRVRGELRHGDAASRLMLEGLTCEIVGALLRLPEVTGKVPGWMPRVIEYLHTAQVRSLNAIAAVAGVHPVHLARQFKRIHGCTIGEYVRRLRIEAAIIALRQTRESIADLASRLGFADQSHFCRCFRRHTGHAPSAFRRLHSE